MKKIIISLFLLVCTGIGIFIFSQQKETKPRNTPSEITKANPSFEKQLATQIPTIPLKVPEGFKVGTFQSTEISGVRDLQFSPNGTLLASLPKLGKVVAVPDANNDGVGDNVITVLSGLNKPHGLAFYKDKLYVAEETEVVRYSYSENTKTALVDKKLFSLPKGGRHTTRSIAFNTSGQMFVSLGSTCDTCVEKDKFLATVIVSDSNGKAPIVYSKGLRNAVFLATNPITNTIWVTEMGRDFLGDVTPPDEINVLEEGKDFGWPYCYANRITDSTMKSSAGCSETIAPYFEIPTHSAPLGITFISSLQFPTAWQNDILVAYHGSWNRSELTGYKVVKISTKEKSLETDFLTGFLTDGKVGGRPVDVTFDKQGSLFVSDDKANAIYKIVAN